MCGSHRNRQLGVAGVVDRQIHSGRNRTAKCALRPAIAGISGGNHHHHTGFDEPIDLDAERTLTASKPFRLKVVSDTHVDTVNPNAPAVAIDLLDLLDGSDQIARLAFAVMPDIASSSNVLEVTSPFSSRCLVLAVMMPSAFVISPAIIPATCVP